MTSEPQATIPRVERRIPRWRDLPARSKGLVVVAVPLAALVFATGVFFVVDQQSRRASDAVARILQVQNSLENVLVLVLDAETGGRGYLLTGDREFLEPLDQARDAMPQALDELRHVVEADGQQQDRVEELGRLIGRRLEISAETTRFGPDDLGSPELRAVLDSGKRATDDIRSMVATIASIEDELLAQRQADADEAQRRGVISVTIALAGGLAGAILAVGLYSRGVSRRLGELREDAESLARGEPPCSVPDGEDEIGVLGRALRDARHELDRRASLLGDRETRLRALFDATPDIILVFDGNGTVLSVNGAIDTVLGYSVEARAGRNASDVIHPDDIDRFREALEQVTSGQADEFALRYRVRHASSRWVDVEARGRAVVDDDGNRNVLVVSRDIGAQLQLEEAQQRARDAAEEANRAKSEFLSHMSHELRTPLNAVLGFAQILELDDLDPGQREAVDHIQKAGHHLLDLINEVLDIARIDAGTMALSPEPVHVGELLAEAVDLIRPLAADRAITIRAIPIDGRDHYVLADRQRMKQVLLNVLSNAVKYNRQSGTISLSCDAQDRAVVAITITDSGHGIRPDVRHLLFTPFERLGATQSDVEGTGIGLALSRRLTEAMGGTIDLASTSGQGSTFVVRLPLVEGPEDRHGRLTPQQTAARRPVSDDVVHTIVHVEDNLSNVRLIERVLAARPDIEVVATMQGRLAIDLIRQHRPVLVLLDLHLADVNGDEVLRELVSDPATSSIPVIMLSADATQGQIQRLLGAGAYAYLTKPLDVRQLITTIDGIIEATHNSGTSGPHP